MHRILNVLENLNKARTDYAYACAVAPGGEQACSKLEACEDAQCDRLSLAGSGLETLADDVLLVSGPHAACGSKRPPEPVEGQTRKTTNREEALESRSSDGLAYTRPLELAEQQRFIDRVGRSKSTSVTESTSPGKRCPMCGVLLGVGLGPATHEGGHLVANWLLEFEPYLTRVQGGRIPFFAVTHSDSLPARHEFIVSSAGI